ncbi:hypothetical protein F5X68DRAFT_55483 [Plectosphaerella plurivora]|uniref:Uncharacterized protein n=1 Tax=Plectosphaerella plurivora TaxID=936078 RepID=A0A9P9A5D3_9PEZI|nr:hypothetical protein F5X68DRAFT_55483 [Plectosphaerella plurivora]
MHSSPGTPGPPAQLCALPVLPSALTGFVYELDELTLCPDLIPPPGAPTFCGHVSVRTPLKLPVTWRGTAADMPRGYGRVDGTAGRRDDDAFNKCAVHGGRDNSVHATESRSASLGACISGAPHRNTCIGVIQLDWGRTESWPGSAVPAQEHRSPVPL